MYHSKRRYSTINKIYKSCRRAIQRYTLFVYQSTEQSTSISFKLITK